MAVLEGAEEFHEKICEILADYEIIWHEIVNSVIIF